MLRRLVCLWLFLASASLAQDVVSVSVTGPKEAVRPGATFDLTFAFEIKEPYHIYGPAKQEFSVPTEVGLAEKEGFRAGEPVFPPVESIDFPAMGGKLDVYEGRVEVTLPVTASAKTREGEHELGVKVSYMACTKDSCLQPEEKALTVRVKVAGEPVEEASPPPKEAAAPPKEPADSAPKGAFDRALEKGILSTLILAFLAGLAGCLTPCVFPVLPVTVAYFGSQGKETWGGRFIIGMAYFLGIVVFYTLIGFGVALLSVNVAQAMALPWVVAVLDLFFLALALNMFGLYEVTLPYWMSGGITEKQRKGVGGAFILGGAMSLVAFPCVGPFIGGLIPYVAAKGDTVVSMAAFMAFGAGLGWPFLFLSIFAGALQSLPKAGEWMVKVKVFFGFSMLGMIVYFTRIFLTDQQILLLAGVISVFQGTFCGAFTQLPRDSGAGAHFGKALGVLLVAGGLLCFLMGLAGDRLRPAGPAAPGRAAEIEWRTGFDAAKEVALREKKPMIVDFTADT